MHEIPPEELADALAFLERTKRLLTPQHVEQALRLSAAGVAPDHMSAMTLDLVLSALTSRTPLSAIRLGDGEGNLLTYRTLTRTPVLDRISADAIIAMQQDHFETEDVWLHKIREQMHQAVLGADIIGVRGMASFRGQRDATGKPPDDIATFLQTAQAQLMHNPRGLWGYWKLMSYVMSLSESGALLGKTMVSAHFYFAVLNGLELMRGKARRLWMITNRTRGAGRIAEVLCPEETRLVPAGLGTAGLTAPVFLDDVETQLDTDMKGDLCLIGAGPWSELYCAMVKARGGVAVDLGSGFDLAEGRQSRPIHKGRPLPDWI